MWCRACDRYQQLQNPFKSVQWKHKQEKTDISQNQTRFNPWTTTPCCTLGPKVVFVSLGSNLTFLFEPSNAFATNNPEEEEEDEDVEL
ncbi:hypothetical protein Q5P01_005721 [Channa striata]|uniref:Uncharacterized protein n=1 Tax=Channa striata TaxID=64152 RepID=A0AA88NGS6_CHASR|nr:hypothetical protein Q5P01_005721 [Channa striata]